MYWSPNFLAVVFKKQEISRPKAPSACPLLGYARSPLSIVVTRMQDLASEFSKIRGGDTLGQPLPAPNPIASAPVLRPKPWSPSTFSRGYAPASQRQTVIAYNFWIVQRRYV